MTRVEIRRQAECFDWSEWFGVDDIASPSPRHVSRYAELARSDQTPVMTILHRANGQREIMGRNA